MNPFALAVVAGSVLTAPAWWAVHVDRTLSADVAVQRWLLCLLALWAVLSVATRMSRAAATAARTAARAVAAAETGTARRLGDESPEPED